MSGRGSGNDLESSHSRHSIVVCAPDLLQYLPENHISFNRDDVSVVSELSIPFSDAPIGEIALSNMTRGKSISTLLSFSAAHQSVMNTLRKEPLTLETLVAEPLDFVVPKRRLSQTTSTSLEELVRERLNDPSMRLTPPTSSEEEDEKEEEEEKNEETKQKRDKEAGVKKVAQKVETEEEFFDTKSGLWKMLSAYDEFVVTPPGFNAFTQATPHWSEKESPSWDKIEESRMKCEDWLSKSNPPGKI